MPKEWITMSKHGMSYHVRFDDGGESVIPICWENPEAFLADLERATQTAFGKPLSELSGRDDYDEFHAAWLDVIKAKMRRE